MIKRRNGNIVTALCTSSAMIAFAFYERHATAAPVPEIAFYLAAAAICLLPVLYALVRHKSCRNKMLKIR
jgi:hypothetical protein